MVLNQCDTYEILSRLFLNGLTEENYDQIGQLPLLAHHLPSSFDPDEAAADHHHLFGFNVFPYESVFLDPSGQLGGDSTTAVIREYRMMEYESGIEAGNPDHIGHELAFLAFVERAVVTASEVGDTGRVEMLQERQLSFINHHLLRWLPPLVAAIGRQGMPLYIGAAALTLNMVVSHRLQLGSWQLDEAGLPEPPEILEDERTSLKDIVVYMLRTAYSGVYLSRDDIGRMAKEQAMPRGFGGREQMLTNLLRSVANYGDAGQIIAVLQDLVDDWVIAYQDMIDKPDSCLSAIAWRDRAMATSSLVRELGHRLADFKKEPHGQLDDDLW